MDLVKVLSLPPQMPPVQITRAHAYHPPPSSSAAVSLAGTAVMKHFGMIYRSDNPTVGSMALKLSRGGAGSFWLGTGCQDRLAATLGLAGSTEARSLPPSCSRLPGPLPGSMAAERAAISQPATCTHTLAPVLTHPS